MARVLILYGTTDGHTRQIAESLGDTLRMGGVDADVVDAAEVNPSVAAYTGVIVAASVHAGRYQRSVEYWVRAHARELNELPTALVSVCLSIAKPSPKVLADLDAIVNRFRKTTGWRPSRVKHVAGALLYTQYNFFKRWLMKRIVSQHGGDTDVSKDYQYTDWQDVKRFAEEFRRHLRDAA
jgi:menaquinone-dependent protoporphyrinogen oxidase